jgi:hypothetical protein
MFELFKNIGKPRNLEEVLSLELKDAELDLYRAQEDYHWNEAKVKYYQGKCERLAVRLLPFSELSK